jgi:hypothetical protein
MGQLQKVGIRDLSIARDAAKGIAHVNVIDPELPRAPTTKGGKICRRLGRCPSIWDDTGVARHTNES